MNQTTSPTPPAPGQVLRVMSYNIFEGAQGRQAPLLELLKKVQPDLLFMQEVLNPASATSLADALQMHHYLAQGNSRTRNVALFSRYPLIHAESFHPFPLLRTLLVSAIVLPTGKRVNLYGVHLGILHDLWRTYELAVILRHIRHHEQTNPAPYALIAGDLNAVVPGDQVHLKHGSRLHRAVLALQFGYATRVAPRLLRRAGFIDSFRALHPRADGFTFPTVAPAVRLDYLFTTRALSSHLRSCEVVTHPADVYRVSDHFPLLAVFDFPNG